MLLIYITLDKTNPKLGKMGVVRQNGCDQTKLLGTLYMDLPIPGVTILNVFWKDTYDLMGKTYIVPSQIKPCKIILKVHVYTM